MMNTQKNTVLSAQLDLSKSTSIEEDNYLSDEQLKKICLSDVRNTRSLALCKYFKKLAKNNITALGIFTLSSANWQSLKNLILDNNKIGCLGCKYLSKIKTINNLNHLDISYHQHKIGNNMIASAGILHLFKTNLNVKVTKLNYNSLNHEAIKLLVRSNWKQLCQLHLMKNELTFSDLLHLLLQQRKLSYIQLTLNLRIISQREKMARLMKPKDPNCKWQLRNLLAIYG